MPMLDPSARERLDRFKATRIAHPTLTSAHAEIARLIEEPAGSAIFLVFGPTGVGKSTLIDGVERQFIRDHLPELQADPQLLPPVTIRASAPSNGQFSWKDFMDRALNALGEPVPSLKRFISEPPAPAAERPRHHSVDGTRQALEAAIRARRPAAIFIDEAQHLANVARSRLQGQLDFIKSLSDATDSVFFLVGTYDLTLLRNLNGQLGRRAWDVHLPRYRLDDPSFRSVVTTFADRLQIDSQNLVKDLEYLYLGSAGCVGILKQWMVRAFNVALGEGHELRAGDLHRTILPADAMARIATEIADGEAAMVEGELVSNQIRELLLGDAPVRAPRRPSEGSTRPRVGKRSPGRDPVALR